MNEKQKLPININQGKISMNNDRSQKDHSWNIPFWSFLWVALFFLAAPSAFAQTNDGITQLYQDIFGAFEETQPTEGDQQGSGNRNTSVPSASTAKVASCAAAAQGGGACYILNDDTVIVGEDVALYFRLRAFSKVIVEFSRSKILITALNEAGTCANTALKDGMYNAMRGFIEVAKLANSENLVEKFGMDDVIHLQVVQTDLCKAFIGPNVVTGTSLIDGAHAIINDRFGGLLERGVITAEYMNSLLNPHSGTTITGDTGDTGDTSNTEG
jgi:hypothetical protein